MYRALIIFCIALLNFNVSGQDYSQIVANEIPVIDTFYNEYIVQDNFRWLENVHSSETTEWLSQQRKQTKKHLSKATYSSNSFESIERYGNIRFNRPVKEGNYYFTHAYYNKLGAPALFYQTSLDHDPEILVDPNYISGPGKKMISYYSVSKDSKLLAYTFSRDGSDWAELKVVALNYGTEKEDHLVGLKFSHIAWRGNGFYYSTISQEGEFGKAQGPKVYYHEMGTHQQEDKLVFERKNPSIDFNFQTTSNERFFVLQERNEQVGKVNIFYIDFESEQKSLKPLIMNLKKELDILDSHNEKFIAETFKDSNNGSIVEIDPANPYKWKQIAGEYSDALLLDVIPFSDRIVTTYQSNQHPIITIIDYSGKILYKLELPIGTSVGGFSGNSTDEELLFNYGSYTLPPIVYKFNIRTFKQEIFKNTRINFEYENIIYKELEVLSKDSVLIPMLLVYEKGLKLDGENPTILKAYGGFGSIVQPSFNPGIVYFIKQGGVFAFANIRGGGDKGVAWAETGRGLHKQNSFDDFISAAEHLINNGYTSNDKLATTGASNGGLVVATAAIQRPDLFKAVVPIVAPLDMIRFENFTVGHWHRDEYGTVNDSTSFTKLYNYSPYNNIKQDQNYPSMLVITSDNDDRVPPFHSYKFVAKLQSRNAQQNPIILKVEKNAGHYGASTVYTNVKERADIYGFIMNEFSK
jgi:prolyl oligopeptidase